MSARAIAIHGNEKSGERRANLEIKSECPALPMTLNTEYRLPYCTLNLWVSKVTGHFVPINFLVFTDHKIMKTLALRNFGRSKFQLKPNLNNCVL